MSDLTWESKLRRLNDSLGGFYVLIPNTLYHRDSRRLVDVWDVVNADRVCEPIGRAETIQEAVDEAYERLMP